MGLFTKKTLYEELKPWLNSVLKSEIPDDVVALSFNLYDDGKDMWSIEVVGTSSFDEKDLDWACDEVTDFGTRDNPFKWKEKAEWETVIAKFKDALKQYLWTSVYAGKIKELRGVGIGFVDGDLELLYVNKEPKERDEKKILLSILKKSVKPGMSLGEIVDAFEKMCRIPMEDDMILHETGTFNFTGKELFYFSLVRQFPNEDEEFCQLHVNVLYTPNEENKKFFGSVWNIDIDGDIFEYIKESEAFKYASRDNYVKIETFLGET